MEDKTNKIKSVWNDIAKTWGRIAGVLAAVGLVATAVVKIFNAPPELTYSLFAALGLILLIISFYVDKQTEYTYQEIVAYEHKARADFTKNIKETKQQMLDMKEDSNKKIDTLTKNVEKVLKISKETRQDTIRIQLLMIMEHQPDNIDTIIKLAEKYFIELKGDWYMTNEFNKWEKAHDVIVPANIYKAIDGNHEEKEEENNNNKE